MRSRSRASRHSSTRRLCTAERQWDLRLDSRIRSAMGGEAGWEPPYGETELETGRRLPALQSGVRVALAARRNRHTGWR
ncbi:hypothetical protein QA600_13420 [Natronococcus sp. A-GB1]|uniref:hypothetical protein n=1 Tax=Natronococcus sp. A-GB1 TaxID=3037648 RepID=UPI00241E9606|nr:hypothetical protein [Natronococcus sp. A-GB1]MDG5760337.1 hypothetical protein [Natronococcus sp. A-GB1]